MLNIDLDSEILSYIPIHKKRLQTYKKGFIYIVGFNFQPLNTYFTDLQFLKRYYKIGKTINLNARQKAIKTCAPFPTKTYHLIEAEDIDSAELYLHCLLNSKRTNGEWFELDKDTLEKLQTIKKMIIR